MTSRKTVWFHNRVKLLRVERGLSRAELAEAVGVHPQTIGYIERREYNPTIDLALRLAGALGVSLDALFSADPFPLLSNEALTRHAGD